MKLRNLTPHPITLVAEDGTTHTLQSEGVVRVSEKSRPLGDALGYPLRQVQYGDVSGLPEAEPDVYLVVSRMVAEACPDRLDLYFPYDPVRDDAGRIVGCRALGTL